MPDVGGLYTYNPSATGTAGLISQLRQMVPDTDLSALPTGTPGEQPSVLFSDQEYQNFLTWNQGDPVYALVQALLTIANNRALMAIRVSLGGGGEVDYGRTPGELRQQAQAIREYYESIPAEAFAEIMWNDTSWRRILWNAVLRSSP